MLSPRRVKPAPTVVLYELRMIRPTTRAEKLARMFESSVKKWRGVARWYLQAHTSARGEAVLQVVSERYAHMARLDNLFTSWRRALGKELQLSKDGAGLKRAVWTAIGAESYMVDVRVMHDVFDAATAKLWVEIAGAADASRCSYIAATAFTAAAQWGQWGQCTASNAEACAATTIASDAAKDCPIVSSANAC